MCLREGGNAIDAAVTAAFVQMVVDPQMCSPGGMGQLVLWLGGDPVEVHFHARAGSLARPDLWLDRITGRTRMWGQYLVEGGANDVGYASIMTPGTVAGLWHAHQKYGRLPWARCLQPAVATAEEGFVVSPSVWRAWTAPSPEPGVRSGPERMRATPESARLFGKSDGNFPYIGERVPNPDLARTLRTLAREGAEAFYRGTIAATMAADLAAKGGLVTAEDLAGYRPVEGQPLRGTYRGYTIYTVVPPGGGLTLLQALNILATYDLRPLDPYDPQTLHLLAGAMRAAFADREWYVGDPAFVEVPVIRLLSRERAHQWRQHLDDGLPVVYPEWQTSGPPSTTHLCVVDPGGHAASLTHTLGRGSGVVTPGLGFMYNNCLSLANPIPGTPNAIAPGKARLTGMCPTLVFKDGRLAMVVGAPGGTAIITSVLQAIVNVLDHGMSAAEAVSFPRLHCEGEHVELEGRWPSGHARALAERGHRVLPSPAGFDSRFGRVQLILVRDAVGQSPAGGEAGSAWAGRRLDAGSDPRGEGGVAWA